MNTPIQGQRAKVELYEDAIDVVAKKEVLAVISSLTDHYMDPPIDWIDEVKYKALMDFKSKLFPTGEPSAPEELEAKLNQQVDF